MLGDEASAEAMDRLRRELGLDVPLPLQYLKFVGGLMHLDLGESIRIRGGVLRAITDVLPSTIELTAATFVVAGVVGLGVGIVAATRRNSLLDNALSVLVLFGVSMPNFWSGILIIL